MAEQLIIRLASQDTDKVHWLVWSKSEEHIIASGELATISHLSELSTKAVHREVVVILPSSDVTLKQLNVPAKSKKAMQLAAPFVIEDDVAQDVDSLFFAYANFSSAEGNCPLAFVEKYKMTHWLTQLATASIQADFVIPEVLAMPPADDRWQTIALGNQVIIRKGQWQGCTIDEPLWPHMLSIWLNADENIAIDAFSPIPHQADNIDINYLPEELPLALMAQHLDTRNFTMLQGEYAAKKERSSLAKTWGLVAGIALLALVLNVAGKAITLMQLNSQIAAVETSVIERYKHAFPQTQRVRIATVKSQLRRQLSTIQGVDNNGDFLALLMQLQPVFAQVPTLKPENLRYDGKRKELRMQATAKGYQDFEKFNAALAPNFTVSQGALNNQGTSVTGAISIKAKSGGNS
ncbi:type II secretion system protein GspL [Thalassotalea sp. 1_MG-2023]|uniref:type II secretion system protein GspL n=1 Tax=Thalassotalea sp. 1_MG-2023 TaxID=3062680 RepID=UPI0026E26351|nr:type II secretion system protein GspL [Thalassotalea sp. 1_MG-2023]MDO6425710.1 type II secretion system protein GspL [Thalassotalea sp. 1_MG-2023]